MRGFFFHDLLFLSAVLCSLVCIATYIYGGREVNRSHGTSLDTVTRETFKQRISRTLTVAAQIMNLMSFIAWTSPKGACGANLTGCFLIPTESKGDEFNNMLLTKLFHLNPMTIIIVFNCSFASVATMFYVLLPVLASIHLQESSFIGGICG